ncbi:hypothetical protein PHYSODRAFT_285629 [Phytophthora sojae]|uniref:Carbohydrate-binding protein n=1 Tax=Phytophthora sojae (strain P6497) TaxID=1094619 RepID=G4Z5F6_PHYSP|nr:hypothetical protein PHYSODRAFT_285629 [Phytophthora sojae]EGZ21634.1 hypothetical protein PHYSODRAFT_285629 [Phytophthora sojae]|eukprot:XP_009524351.1 hypothetical protein PHYSODRAFT_285629 [Phytophthora sojae]
MWPRVAAASALLLLQGGAVAQDCAYTVSVLDVPGVQCVSAAPCSGTYYASGLSQGVGACPSGSSCALLPQTPIMGCAAAGRTDLIYVNADGTLTKDGKSVTLPDATTTTTTTSTTAPSTTSSTTSSTASSKSTASSTSSSTSSTTGSSNGSKSTSSSSNANGSNSNASSGSSSNANANSDGGSDALTDSSNSTVSSDSASHSASNSNSNSSDSSSSASNSWSSSDSTAGSIVSPGSSSANQQSFNPGSILSDSSSTVSNGSDSGISLTAIICIVVGCLAVVAIAAGARLLQKGKEAEGELTTPEGAAMEGYNGGEGGGSGMTPKENVLLL